MKKLSILLACLFAMLATGTGLKAQEVTVTLIPGWTWISYPTTEAVDFVTALGDFTPMAGDVIKSQWGSAIYRNGQWKGTISQFNPGYGYHYYSNRTEPVAVTFNALQPASQVVVTTLEPTDITTTNAVVGSTVTINAGNHIFARGICWGTEPNPDIDGNHTSDDLVVGSHSVTLEGITPNTTYYIRSYAVTDYGLAYGDELNFTTEQIPSYTITVSSNPMEGGSVAISNELVFDFDDNTTQGWTLLKGSDGNSSHNWMHSSEYTESVIYGVRTQQFRGFHTF